MLRARGAAIVSGFIDETKFSYRQLDRNARAKLLHTISALERTSKRHGCPNGALGRPCVEVLRALLYKFADRATGKCFPSIDAIVEATNYCRRTVVYALQRLEDIGALDITRRLVRTPAGARQGSNLYRFGDLPRLINLPGLSAARPRPVFVQARVQHMTAKTTQGVFDEVRLHLSRPLHKPADWREAARRMIGA
jgi:Helix-turn-helix domain